MDISVYLFYIIIPHSLSPNKLSYLSVHGFRFTIVHTPHNKCVLNTYQLSIYKGDSTNCPISCHLWLLTTSTQKSWLLNISPNINFNDNHQWPQPELILHWLMTTWIDVSTHHILPDNRIAPNICDSNLTVTYYSMHTHINHWRLNIYQHMSRNNIICSNQLTHPFHTSSGE